MTTDRKGGWSACVNLAFHGLKGRENADEIKTNYITTSGLAINENTHMIEQTHRPEISLLGKKTDKDIIYYSAMTCGEV